MKTLFSFALTAVARNVDSKEVGPGVYLLPPHIKAPLLEIILSHDLLTKTSRPCIVKRSFFSDLRKLVLPRSEQMDDQFMNTIAASGCELKEIYLAVPMIPTVELRAKLTGRGVSALLGTQSALEILTLNWCVNFKQGVLNRIHSDRLRVVEIHGDAVCSCFANSGYAVRDEEIQLYQRDVSFLAINNPTITHLHLDSVILNLPDCHSLCSALSNCLEHLTIKVIRYYAYCEREHCFYGRDFIPFLEMVDSKCHRLRSLSCFCYKPDWQPNRQLRMHSDTLECLSLEGHTFEWPPILPRNIRKLKLSLHGSETSEYVERLCHDRLPNLERLYIHLVENYMIGDECGLATLFWNLGPKIVSITDINGLAFDRFVHLISEHCLNLKTLGVLHLTAPTCTAYQLLPLFRDEQRARRMKHLRLTIDYVSQSLLGFIASNCTNLRTLDLAYCQAVNDTLLSQVAINCTGRLSTLEISYCHSVTDQGIRAIAINCSDSLQEICMLGTSVGDEGVLAVAMNCTQLRVCRFDKELISASVKEKLKEFSMNRVIGFDT